MKENGHVRMKCGYEESGKKTIKFTSKGKKRTDLMNIEEFNFLWTTKKEDYVLVNTEHGYGIVDKKEKRVLCISDENLSQAVIQKMIAEGTKIYEDILDAYADV